jgi:hypothetical protein
MVFYDTLNNITVISWRSVLLVEETGVPGKKPTVLSQVSDKLYHMLHKVHLTWALIPHVVIDPSTIQS